MQTNGSNGFFKLRVTASLAGGLGAFFILQFMPSLVFAQEIVRLVPALKSEPLKVGGNASVEGVTLSELSTAIGRDTIVSLSDAASMARIVAIGDGFTIASQDDLVLVAGELPPAVASYSIYRPGRIHTRIVERVAEQRTPSGEIKSQIQELVYSGKAAFVAESQSDAAGTPKAWFRLTKSVGVIRVGDVIVSEAALNERSHLSMPSILTTPTTPTIQSGAAQDAHEQRRDDSPAADALEGQVLSFFSEQQWGAKHSTLLLNRGRADGLTRGMRIMLAPPTKLGKERNEVFAEETAQAISYSHMPYFSLAFVVSASQPIERGSRITRTLQAAP